MTDMLQEKPENPSAGDSYIDIRSRTVNVFDGKNWQTFTEYELIEMEVMSLLIGTGRTAEEAERAIHILQHGHSHGANDEA